MEPPHHLPYPNLIIRACTPYLVHVPHGILAYLMDTERLALQREDVDIYALFLPHTVVTVPFCQDGTAVTDLCIIEEVRGVRLMRLQSHC